MGGAINNKAILASNEVEIEVEAELGNLCQENIFSQNFLSKDILCQ